MSKIILTDDKGNSQTIILPAGFVLSVPPAQPTPTPAPAPAQTATSTPSAPAA